VGEVSLSFTGTDPDRLLEGYRGTRAQEPLFDLRISGPPVRAFGATGYDEFIDAAGEVRPAWREVADLVGERGRDGMERLTEVLRGLVDDDGITYIEIDRHGEAVTDSHGMAMVMTGIRHFKH
jgi:hypothetical protein